MERTRSGLAFTSPPRFLVGTLESAAPEQLGRLGEAEIGPHSDVYGFARTCCFALFGTTLPLLRHWRQVPEALAELLERCLSEQPRERLSDFGAVLLGLAALRE